MSGCCALGICAGKLLYLIFLMLAISAIMIVPVMMFECVLNTADIILFNLTIIVIIV